MRNKSIYLKVLLLSAFSLSSYAKMNVGSSNNQLTVAAKVSAGCRNTTAQFDLDINNVRARILNGGDLWWDPVGQTPYYEVPIGSNKTSIYSGALWIAGLDNNNQIKAACQTYRQSGANDFWGGPISKDGLGLLDVSVATCEQYDRFWTITKAEVETFVASGEATSVIQQWPGNGNTALGQEPTLAPFIDVDNDGIYNYTAGDYPAYNLSGDYPVLPGLGVVCNDYLFGDKTVWWVFNDVGNSHTETFSNSPIGLEVRAQAFGFRTADDINNMTFYKYQVINRSNDQLNNTYFGVWCDPDLGNASDDYVGCDVGLGLGYCYNADPDDDGAGGYGLNPPAVGIDFFQGPLADTGDGIDNDKDGEIDEIGEQIIMSKFLYYENVNTSPIGNPEALDDYYQYLSGIWIDGQAVTYGESGRNPANPVCNYMFPELTDPDNPTLWTMSSASIPANDMRWLQSAGTFTLKPGAVNYVTTGVVWAKATAGGPGASLNLMKLADQKAQALFDNCFKVLDGPNAPDLAIRELDRQLILKLENTKTAKIEFYNEIDPTIPPAVPNSGGGLDTLTSEERSYKFQGYRVYQLANKNVGSQELTDLSKAKLIRQIDLKDDIWKIVNYSFNGDLSAWFPTQVADSNSTTNVGLVHDLIVTKDEFTGQNLINFKPYYYMVVSYGYNNFRPFNPSNGSFTQSQAYKQGRLNVKVYSAIPHKPVVNNGGSIFNAGIGESFEVKRIEGQGNGGNILDFTEATVNEILTSSDHQAENPVYQAGRGPVNPQVVDPVEVKNGDLKLLFEPLTSDPYWGLMTRTTPKADIINITIGDDATERDIDTLYISTASPSDVVEGRYVRVDNIAGITSAEGLNQEFFRVVEVTNSLNFAAVGTGFTGAFVAGTGTAEAVNDISTYDVSIKNSELISDHGIKLDVYNDASIEFGGGSTANGFLGASITDNNWLSFLPDNGAGANLTTIYDWIRPIAADPGGVYQDVLGGTWAPAKSCNLDALTGVIPSSPPVITNFMKVEDLASVDIVFTNDKNKWTRSVVLESGSGTLRYLPKTSLSKDKFGRTTATGGSSGTSENDADFISATGMGWFPGYAINLETGERLNIAFCENSSLPDENGDDMLFNPTSNITNGNGADVLGGMHFIWVFGHNLNGTNDVPKYDFGQHLISKLSNSPSTTVKRAIYKDIMWVSVPLARFGTNFNDGIPDTDVKVRLRVAKSFRSFLASGATAVNGSNPSYEFNIPASAEISANQGEVASDALDMIRIVPNPYYAYSSYEKTREDQLENRVRIVNLPSSCTISIYTLNGTLVRQIKRDVAADVSFGQAVQEGKDDNLASSIDWDLKNTSGITIASGVYYIHIDAGSLGEKVVKWLGVIRPIDLDTF